MNYSLRFHTSNDWTETVLNNFDAFLLDHATCEKKASGMAMSMVSHYPDRSEIVSQMIDLAIEELHHYREVVKLMRERGLILGADLKDPYVNAFRKSFRSEAQEYLLDRLLIGSIIEARGHERFGLIAEALPEGKLKEFYQAITLSEGRHLDLFVNLAALYFPQQAIDHRLDQLLDVEADIIKSLPFRAALH
ncbi:MAG: tRNA-(ms[2]io[6]A)-hydroxylase [Gammaproteobacteria bacterium]|nr:MAG: tRNA-(ms[2]io[6]A)-hydroxylase [Gammaproteobacteria bacterium]